MAAAVRGPQRYTVGELRNELPVLQCRHCGQEQARLVPPGIPEGLAGLADQKRPPQVARAGQRAEVIAGRLSRRRDGTFARLARAAIHISRRMLVIVMIIDNGQQVAWDGRRYRWHHVVVGHHGPRADLVFDHVYEPEESFTLGVCDETIEVISGRLRSPKGRDFDIFDRLAGLEITLGLSVLTHSPCLAETVCRVVALLKPGMERGQQTGIGRQLRAVRRSG